MSDSWLKIGSSFVPQKEKKRDKKKKEKKEKKSKTFDNHESKRIEIAKPQNLQQRDALSQFTLQITAKGEAHDYRIYGTSCVADNDLYDYGLMGQDCPIYKRLPLKMILGFD